MFRSVQVSSMRVAVLLAPLLMLSPAVQAEPVSPDISGTWQGVGALTTDGIGPDVISCKATVTHKAGNEYFSNFTCFMKAYGQGSQVATFERSGNQMKGGFMFGQDMVKLDVSIDKSGKRQTVKVGGARWKGNINMVKN